jgi:hypothetical protein
LKHANESQVICGDCILGGVPDDERSRIRIDVKAWCPKNDHFEMGKQEALELFGLDCMICLEKVAEKFDQPQDSFDRIRTPCGKHQAAFSA